MKIFWVFQTAIWKRKGEERPQGGRLRETQKRTSYLSGNASRIRKIHQTPTKEKLFKKKNQKM